MTNDEPSRSISDLAQSPVKLTLSKKPQNSSNQRPLSSTNRPLKIPRIESYFSDEDAEVEEEEGCAVMGKQTGMQRYLIAVEYMGTRFSGCQEQRPVFRTVVSVLKDAFQKFIGQPVLIGCSSRTDAGVHALSNVFHVDVERISKRKPGEVKPPHEPLVVKNAVNHFLQKKEGDIMVIDVRCVSADFNARHKALERTYFYRLLSGPEPLSIFEKDRAWHIQEELDLLSMQQACNILSGHHDFSSFRASGCQAKSPIRTLDELNVSEIVSSPNFPSLMERNQSNCTGEYLRACSMKSETHVSVGSISKFDSISISNVGIDEGFGVRRRHRCFVVTARARSFLYHQVRLLVGVLKAVGTGELNISDVERILNAKSVTAASPMAPACGLYLANVKYDLPKDA